MPNARGKMTRSVCLAVSEPEASPAGRMSRSAEPVLRSAEPAARTAELVARHSEPAARSADRVARSAAPVAEPEPEAEAGPLTPVAAQPTSPISRIRMDRYLNLYLLRLMVLS